MGGHERRSNTGGVKPMMIAGRVATERERLRYMSPADRAWRKQWLEDQVLAHDEPRIVPELRKELVNPIRRMYQAPMDMLFRAMSPRIGVYYAGAIRFTLPKVLMIIGSMYVGLYYFKYASNDWTRKNGWMLSVSRPRSVPGDPDFPKLSERNSPEDHHDCGFKGRNVFVD